AVLAAGQTAAVALSRPSPHAPDDHQGRVSGLPTRRAGRAPPEAHAPTFAAPCLRHTRTRSGGGSSADPTLAGPSELTDDQSLPPCHTACPARNPEPPGCVASGQAPMNRPALEVADVVRQYGAAYLARYGSTLSPEQHRALRAIAV